MDSVLSHWIHLTVLRFTFVYVCFVYAYFVQLWFLSFSLSWHRLNFECRSEMCCTQLAENTGPKNYAKNRCLCTRVQGCEQLAHSRNAAAPQPGVELATMLSYAFCGPADHKSNAVPVIPPRHPFCFITPSPKTEEN